MGRLFTSFEDAWAAFLDREEPLEDFFAQFPEDEAYVTIWQAPPGSAITAEIGVLQRELAGLDSLRATPAHWLHVTLGHGGEDDFESVRERLGGFRSFDAEYGPAACFHEALVLEGRSDRFADLAGAIDPQRDLSVFLPHVSIAYVDGAPAPGPIRERLIALRNRPPVRDRVTEVRLCVVPVARHKVMTPWRVAGVIPLE